MKQTIKTIQAIFILNLLSVYAIAQETQKLRSQPKHRSLLPGLWMATHI